MPVMAGHSGLLPVAATRDLPRGRRDGERNSMKEKRESIRGLELSIENSTYFTRGVTKRTPMESFFLASFFAFGFR